MKRIILIEEEQAIIDLFNFANKNNKIIIEIVPFKSLPLIICDFNPENSQIIVDISRNANYILICNRLKKMFDNKLKSINLLVNRDQFNSLQKDFTLQNILILLTKTEDIIRILNNSKG